MITLKMNFVVVSVQNKECARAPVYAAGIAHSAGFFFYHYSTGLEETAEVQAYRNLNTQNRVLVSHCCAM